MKTNKSETNSYGKKSLLFLLVGFLCLSGGVAMFYYSFDVIGLNYMYGGFALFLVSFAFFALFNHYRKLKRGEL